MSGPFDVVVPTVGRRTLGALLDALARLDGPRPGRVLVVSDVGSPDQLRDRLSLAPGVEVLAGRGRGPAAARNVGWGASRAEWIAFLDDDVVPEPAWLERLADDLSEPGIAASQGRIRVPLSRHRRATDWERNVAGLERARWATADMAFRRSALAAVGGFDERFPRAYREDADLALRLSAAGFRLARGRRTVVHPVRPAGPLVSLRLQAGNADDALMDRLHGRAWRKAAHAPPGRRARHLSVAGLGTAAALAGFLGARGLAAAAGAAWVAGTAELGFARIAPGPRTAREVATMVGTSMAMPFAAAGWWLAGVVRARRLAADTGRAPLPDVPAAVLFDRDGTLVEDVPYNGDPQLVTTVTGAREALDRLRAAGIATAVVSNQSGVARGLVTAGQVDAVNRRIEDVLGPLGPWLVCPHGPDDGCACRKPEPGLVLRAAETLGVPPERCAVIGDIGADADAARAAGARAILVPNARTRVDEVAAAVEVAPDLPTAVARLLGEAA